MDYNQYANALKKLKKYPEFEYIIDNRFNDELHVDVFFKLKNSILRFCYLSKKLFNYTDFQKIEKKLKNSDLNGYIFKEIISKKEFTFEFCNTNFKLITKVKIIRLRLYLIQNCIFLILLIQLIITKKSSLK